MSKLQNKLSRDISYLSENKIPMESSGLRIEKLDYEGDSAGEEMMTDDDVLALSEAIQKNDIFQGPLDLSKNGLSDLVSYNFAYIFLSYFIVCSLSQGRFGETRSCEYHQAQYVEEPKLKI